LDAAGALSGGLYICTDLQSQNFPLETYEEARRLNCFLKRRCSAFLSSTLPPEGFYAFYANPLPKDK
jgi:hypothetical protein